MRTEGQRVVKPGVPQLEHLDMDSRGAIMRCFLVSFLPFLILLQPVASSHCQEFPRSFCENHTTFVPGHNLIGEGFDITTLTRKGAYVVDTRRWQEPNGRCTLCRNPLMAGQLQKLPLAGMDWRVLSNCVLQASSFVENSDIDVANAMAKEVSNNWGTELGFPTEAKDSPEQFKAKVVFAGSQSQMTIYAHEKSRQDRHTFFSQEVSCKYYSLRLLQSPSLLARHFTDAVNRLPREFHAEEYQHFINIYGTHYISHVQLGGRVRYLLAIRTCALALQHVTASTLNTCFKLETAAGYDWLFGSIFFSPRCQDLLRTNGHMNFHNAYAAQIIELVGGDQPVDMLFSKDKELSRFSKWMENVKVKPGLVSYSLLSLHTLLEHNDPRRNLLKNAIVDHINRRALKRDCPQKCPPWSSDESCMCMCQADAITSNTCCALERGRAHLIFHVKNGSNLWADHFSATDAFVKVFFQDQERQTRIIKNNNNPTWNEILDFGAVTLMGSNTFLLEIWDKDVWCDDLLRKCHGKLVAGGSSTTLRCYASHGHIEYSYSLKCGPTLAGPSCQNYVPLRLPTSYFNNTNS